MTTPNTAASAADLTALAIQIEALRMELGGNITRIERRQIAAEFDAATSRLAKLRAGR